MKAAFRYFTQARPFDQGHDAASAGQSLKNIGRV